MQRARRIEPAVTELLKGFARRCGGKLVGLATRFKTQERIQEKYDRGKTPRDALRYTIVFSPRRYMCAASQLCVRMLAHPRLSSRSSWLKQRWPLGDGYQGVNSSWQYDGDDFELQVHTPASLREARSKDSHTLYENMQRACGTNPTSEACIKLQEARLRREAEVPTPIPPALRDANIFALHCHCEQRARAMAVVLAIGCAVHALSLFVGWSMYARNRTASARAVAIASVVVPGAGLVAPFLPDAA